MDLRPGEEVLFFGANATMCLIGWDTFPSRKTIRKAEMQQPLGAKPINPKREKKELFRG